MKGRTEKNKKENGNYKSKEDNYSYLIKEKLKEFYQMKDEYFNVYLFYTLNLNVMKILESQNNKIQIEIN